MGFLLPIAALVSGLILGALLVWLALRISLTERLAAKQEQVTQMQSLLATEVDQRKKLTHDLQQECSARASAEERTRSLEEKLVTDKKEIEDLQRTFQKEFEATANKLLNQSATSLIERSGQNIKTILEPLGDKISEFRKKLEDSQKENSNYAAVLKEKIGQIGDDAANLAKALKGDVKVLGNWGENRLDQILEKSGLQKNVHYRRQVALANAEGERLYPDVVVQLPDNKSLVIDSKVSLANYDAYVNASEEEARQRALENLARDVRAHFTALGAKRYHDLYGISAPDFVLMYIPIEPAYFAALSHKPELFSEALKKNVVLTTNSSLLGTLLTAASVWRLADQQKHALEIARRGGELYDKFVGMLESLADLDKHLKGATDKYAEAMGRLHDGRGNVVWQIEELKRLGAKASKAIPAQLVEKGLASNETVRAPLLSGSETAPEIPLSVGSQNG